MAVVYAFSAPAWALTVAGIGMALFVGTVIMFMMNVADVTIGAQHEALAGTPFAAGDSRFIQASQRAARAASTTAGKVATGVAVVALAGTVAISAGDSAPRATQWVEGTKILRSGTKNDTGQAVYWRISSEGAEPGWVPARDPVLGVDRLEYDLAEDYGPGVYTVELLIGHIDGGAGPLCDPVTITIGESAQQETARDSQESNSQDVSISQGPPDALEIEGPSVEYGGTVQGKLSTSSSSTMRASWSFRGEKGDLVNIRTRVTDDVALFEPVIFLYDSSGDMIAESVRAYSGTQHTIKSFRLPARDVYVIEVAWQGQPGKGTFELRIDKAN
jgi:hypothetical protein